MGGILRATGAAGLAWVVASGALASPLPDARYASIDWMEPCSLPSATTSSPFARDAHVQLVSDSEPAAEVSSCLDCGDGCDDCCGDGCCGDDCCGDGCDGCGGVSSAAWCGGPKWIVSTGAIFLHRSRPGPAPIMTPPTGTPGKLIAGSDFGFGGDSGPDVSIIRRTSSGVMFEGRYFNDRTADAAFQIPQVTTFRVAGIGVTILGGGSINSFYTTKLDSSELNVHVPVRERVTFLTGFRWIELHDFLRSNIATPTTFVSWDENNHLYGGQFGTNIRFTDWSNPLGMALALKGGVYGNDADNDFRSNIVSSRRSSATDVSFVGEVNFTASYRLTRHIALRGGYQVLWLENVAIAADAAARTTQVAGGTSSPTDTNGRVWYNGATTAVEFVW